PGAGVATLTAASGSSEVFVAAYTSAGNYLWAFQIRTSAYSLIAVDGSGNVVVTGSTFNGTVDFDPGVGTTNLTAISTAGDKFIARYSPTGNYLWAFQISNASTQALAVDGSGNIIVTGDFGLSVDFDPGPGNATMNATASQG